MSLNNENEGGTSNYWAGTRRIINATPIMKLYVCLSVTLNIHS